MELTSLLPQRKEPTLNSETQWRRAIDRHGDRDRRDSVGITVEPVA
jgi:hypothetical protein